MCPKTTSNKFDELFKKIETWIAQNNQLQESIHDISIRLTGFNF